MNWKKRLKKLEEDSTYSTQNKKETTNQDYTNNQQIPLGENIIEQDIPIEQSSNFWHVNQNIHSKEDFYKHPKNLASEDQIYMKSNYQDNQITDGQHPFPNQNYNIQDFERAGLSYASRYIIQKIQQNQIEIEDIVSKKINKRIMAALLDTILFFAPMYLIYLLFLAPSVNVIRSTTDFVNIPISYILKTLAGKLFVFSVISTLFYIAYYVLLPALILQGQTIGKKMMRLRIITSREREIPNVKTMFMREVVGKIFSVLTVIGFLMILFGKKHQGLHDKIAKTVVIDDEY